MIDHFKILLMWLAGFGISCVYIILIAIFTSDKEIKEIKYKFKNLYNKIIRKGKNNVKSKMEKR